MDTATKYKEVMDQVAALIDQGILAEGAKIPSVRKMSQQSGFSMMTVLEGYKRLEEQGIIESRPQSGFYVRPAALRRPEVWKSVREARTERITIREQKVKIAPEVEAIISQGAREDLIRLGAGLPDPEMLPSEELSLRMARVVRNAPLDVNRYSLKYGEPRLIEQLNQWMAGYACIPEKNEIITADGCTQALLISLRAVTRAGDLIAVESPGYFGFYSMLQFLQLKSIEIPSDPQTGFNVDAFEKAIAKQKPKAVLLMSAHANPTGASMPDEEKKRLTNLCARKGIALIEDDTYGEMHFGPERPRPLKYFDPQNVIYLGSFSKSLAPGYRVAWTAGGKYSADIFRCKDMGILSTPMPTQLTIASYLADGGIVRHLKRLRKTYAENVRFYQSSIASHFPDGTRVSAPQGGHFLWVEQPEGFDSVALGQQTLKHGISIAPGIIFSARQNYRRFFRLNCALTWTDEIENALIKTGQLCEKIS